MIAVYIAVSFFQMLYGVSSSFLHEIKWIKKHE